MHQLNNLEWLRVFEIYNECFSIAYNAALNDELIGKIGDQDHYDEYIQQSVYNSIQNWHDIPLSPELPAITAGKIIDDISSAAEAVNLAKYAAILCDDDIPDIVKIKMGSFGTEIINEMVSYIIACDWEAKNDDNSSTSNDVIICMTFLKILGEWNAIECHKSILSKFCSLNEPSDLIAEAIRQYLISIGFPVVPEIIAQIRNGISTTMYLNSACEYLLIALTDIGKDNHDEQIFACLKDSFRKMKNKAIGAICLGDYGDGRGVSALKGWLDQHPEENDRQVISEVLSSIKRLGGDVSDVQYRLNLKRPQA